MQAKALSKPFGCTAAPLDTQAGQVRSREMPIGNFFTDAMRAQHRTDVAMFQGGGTLCLLGGDTQILYEDSSRIWERCREYQHGIAHKLGVALSGLLELPGCFGNLGNAVGRASSFS